MRCPNCRREIRDGSLFCPECGAALTSSAKQQNGQLVTNTGLLLGAAAREARRKAEVRDDQLVSARTYNCVIMVVLLWGLLVNVLLCYTVGSVYRYVDPFVFLIGYFICAFAGIFIAGRSHSPTVSFIGYNLVVIPFGLVISTMVEAYGGTDSRIVADAFQYTMIITAGMTAMAVSFPDLFSRLGGALLGVLAGLLICEIVLLFLHKNQEITDWIAAGLFSLYIGYDVWRSQQFPKTVDNAVDSALDIYMDIANLFLRLLSILGRRNRK